MKRKILALILCIMLVLPCMNMGVSAAKASGKCGENVTWEINNGGGILTISGKGDMADYDTFTDTPWYDYISGISTIVIKEGVTSIGDSAFGHIEYLDSVNIADSVTSIGSYAFESCPFISDIIIPNNVITIGEGAFANCKDLTTVTLPISLTTIERNAFFNCSTFFDDGIINNVYYRGTKTQWNSIVIESQNDSLTLAPIHYDFNMDWSFDSATQTLTITGNGEMKDFPTFTSADWDEYKSIIQTVVIEKGVTSIGRMAFSYCSALKNVIIPDSVTTISDNAFAYCKALTTINIPDSITTIGSNAFAECVSLTSITIPEKVTALNDGTFYGCQSLTKVVLPANVTIIKEGAFDSCNSLKDIYYDGAEAKWHSIMIGGYNEALHSANIYFESDGSIDSSKLFKDVPSTEWYKSAIDYVVENSLMNGVGDGTRFDPNGSMTRAMVVTVLYRLEGSPTVYNTTPFTDLKADWYKDAVTWAYKTGVVTGTSASTFSPDGNVTREQIATILYRYANYKGLDTSTSADIVNFPDSASVGTWSYYAMQWATGVGLITGATQNGSIVLAPQGEASRAQVATILMRFCKM